MPPSSKPRGHGTQCLYTSNHQKHDCDNGENEPLWTSRIYPKRCNHSDHKAEDGTNTKTLNQHPHPAA